jgi:hypothetical protein
MTVSFEMAGLSRGAAAGGVSMGPPQDEVNLLI